jgi:predicted Zn-dependent protease
MNDINIVVIKDHKKGTYFANKADQASVILAVQAATEATQEAESDEANRVAPDQGMIERSMGPAEPDMEMLFFRMEELREAVAKEYPLIAVGNISANYSKRTMVYKNTNGTLCREVGGSYFIGMAFAGREGDKITSECWCNIETYHLNQPILECGNFRNKLALIEKQLQSRPMKGKFIGTVLMNTDSVVEFVGYLKEIAAGNNQILDGTSMWMDKIGKKVASEKLSIRFDPLDERIVRSETLTFDGFISKGYEWIVDGVLQTYAIDYYTSE